MTTPTPTSSPDLAQRRRDIAQCARRIVENTPELRLAVNIARRLAQMDGCAPAIMAVSGSHAAPHNHEWLFSTWVREIDSLLRAPHPLPRQRDMNCYECECVLPAATVATWGSLLRGRVVPQRAADGTVLREDGTALCRECAESTGTDAR